MLHCCYILFSTYFQPFKSNLQALSPRPRLQQLPFTPSLLARSFEDLVILLDVGQETSTLWVLVLTCLLGTKKHISISIIWGYPYLIVLLYKGVYMGYPYPNFCLCGFWGPQLKNPTKSSGTLRTEKRGQRQKAR